MVTMNGVIYAASDVYKSHTTSIDSFKSREFGPLGYIDPDRVHFRRENLLRRHIDNNNPEFNVDLIKFVVGMDDKFIKASVASNAKGNVIEVSGTGMVNDTLADGISYALNQGVRVVICSRCEGGRTYPVYGTKAGANALLEQGCILSSLSGPKARILLIMAINALLSRYELQQLFDPAI